MKRFLKILFVAVACMAILMASLTMMVAMEYCVSLCKFGTTINAFVCLPIITFIVVLFANFCGKRVYNLSK